ncbi:MULTISPECIES: hypothetical protein [Phyllobacteriaceae]|jgi:hypothetical protein|uniref:Uncharacterized protein n=1 Tax=Mesorhizobium hungaricum TaxID=1566387 RepID=A0A1C2DD81_9HYPH|nr:MULTISPECIES: hypothetical protein [Mesorhizobium]MBN9235081.1 hypothetical protein [Mesorhizobium sp.]MBN9592532.1 hypothetical protein [Alphaproteobacteria bacterium]OCX12718.1 hypothetical protein QV13_24275 [Mesorhizobium hungaricum]
MFSLLSASALLCVALFAFRRFLIIPWFVCTVVDYVTWPLGWHRGKFGADAIHFVRRDANAKRLTRLKPHRGGSLFALAAVMLVVAGCQTSQLDGSLQKNLPAICTASEQAHRLYLLAVAADRVSERTQRRVDTAWVSLQPVCADPSKQTAVDIITAAFAAYLTISAATH